MSQEFVKNTDKPHEDSFLWQLGDGWKISQKTGDVYASIDTITDEVLGTTLTDISETGKIDIIEYQSYFFVPNKFVDKKGKVSWSVFAFENRVKADKKLADIKKFASYQPQTTTTTTVPKPVSRPSLQQGQQTITSKPVTASTISTTPMSLTATHIPYNPSETIVTYTDPKEVDSSNTEYIATLQTDGYSFLPKSLVSETSWTETIYDKDEETGNIIEIGKRRLYLMGRILNVKIADN